MALKLIIDADPGIGDALAIALAICDPEVELLALTAVAGQVSGEVATCNLLSIVSLLDADRLPRIGVSDGHVPPIPMDRGYIAPALLNGPHGLGDCPLLDVMPHQRHDAAKVLVEVVRQHPQEVTLLTLGPLTNVFRAIELHPDFMSQLRGLVCLGGSINAGGDVTAAAEFNIAADPEAAQHVLTCPATKTLVPRDVSTALMLSFDSYQRWECDELTRRGRLLSQMIPFALRASRQHLGLEGVLLPEVVALAAVTQPRLFERMSANVDVELFGKLTRGMTVIDRRPWARWKNNADILTGVEAQGVLDYMSRFFIGR